MGGGGVGWGNAVKQVHMLPKRWCSENPHDNLFKKNCACTESELCGLG